MTVTIEPWDDAYELEFVEPCLYGHEECSDVAGGSCTAPMGLCKSQLNVLNTIAHHADGICTPHIVRFMLNHGMPEGALSVTKRITELRRLGFPIVGGTMHHEWCVIPSHHHGARVGFYLMDY